MIMEPVASFLCVRQLLSARRTAIATIFPAPVTIAALPASRAHRIPGNAASERKDQMPEIATQWRRFDEVTAGELYELLRFRQSIFVVEQACTYPDLDGLDQSAWHLLARMESELIGYLRLMVMAGPPAIVRIGRVAVSPSLRRGGLGRMLMEKALTLCRERFPLQAVALGAQAPLVPFYESFGFATTSEPYDDFGVAHVEMVLRLSG
jgi:ElaA protein